MEKFKIEIKTLIFMEGNDDQYCSKKIRFKVESSRIEDISIKIEEAINKIISSIKD